MAKVKGEGTICERAPRWEEVTLTTRAERAPHGARGTERREEYELKVMAGGTRASQSILSWKEESMAVQGTGGRNVCGRGYKGLR